MNDIEIKLMGAEELHAKLNEMDYKMQHSVIKRVVSDAANIYLRAAKGSIPIRKTKLQPSGKKWHPPGAGKKSIMKKMGKSRSVATVFVGPRTNTGSYETDGYYLKWPEFGTVKMSPRRWLSFAYGRTKKQVEDQMIESVRKILLRIWAKNNK